MQRRAACRMEMQYEREVEVAVAPLCQYVNIENMREWWMSQVLARLKLHRSARKFNYFLFFINYVWNQHYVGLSAMYEH